MSPPAAAVLGLQRAAGNAAVARMLARSPAPAGEEIEDEPDWLREEDEGEGEEEDLPLEDEEDALAAPVVEGEGAEPDPRGLQVRAEPQPPGPPDAALLQRSVIVADAAGSATGGAGIWRPITAAEREQVVRRNFRGRQRRLAWRVLADMSRTSDEQRFSSLDELRVELLKRVTTSLTMQDSQARIRRGEGDEAYTVQAFGYPFSGDALLYGPRVNYAARAYWTPQPPDNYARRRDRAKVRQIRSLPRNRRHEVYGDMADYRWTLSADGRRDPWEAIMRLFVPQSPHRRTLIHCDYLVSLVHFRSFAAAVGKEAFNQRIAAHGHDRVVLDWNLFTNLDMPTRPGDPSLQSLQSVHPADESDLVIGDHVYFFNHEAYDAINARIGNAWRLENAVLVDQGARGEDVFLGHGSGRKTTAQMKAKLAEEYNDVARVALRVTSRVDRGEAGAEAELRQHFPNVVQEPSTGDWRVRGAGLAGDVDVDLRLIRPDEVLGLHDPWTPGRLYAVRRPVESR